jgi:hypothetical protein
MAIPPIGTVMRPRRRPAAAQLTAQAPLPPIAPPSDVGGEWPIDQASAQKYAQQTLAGIDWSKPYLMLYVPGTANPDKGEVQKVNPEFVAEMFRQFPDGDAELAMMRYAGTWDMRGSISTGVEVLRIVLRAIAARPGPKPKVLIGGESQGAWVISEATKDPVARGAMTRAAIFGHPSLAGTHFEDGHDPDVLETNHHLDHVAMPLKGDRAKAMDAQIALETSLTLDKIPLLAQAFLADPLAGSLSIAAQIRDHLPLRLRPFWVQDHHDYRADMHRGVEFLRTGVRTPHPDKGH